VELVDVLTHRSVDRVYAATDGSFEIGNVPSGMYELRVSTPFGEVLVRADADVRQHGTQFIVQLPARKPENQPAGESVSVATLRHKPVKAAWKAARDAQARSEKGDHAGAEKLLRKATELDPEYASAFTNLGAQYIRLQRPAEAEAAFRRALELDPATAMNYSNLAFALLVLNRTRDAEPLARRAVQMDATSPLTNCVLGYVLARSSETQRESIAYLRKAAPDVKEAGTVLNAVQKRLSVASKTDALTKGLTPK
jgi:tetratricopeptide (TPR) repeat protein